MQGRNRGAPGTGFPNATLRRTDAVIETIRAIQLPADVPLAACGLTFGWGR